MVIMHGKNLHETHKSDKSWEFLLNVARRRHIFKEGGVQLRVVEEWLQILLLFIQDTCNNFN